MAMLRATALALSCLVCGLFASTAHADGVVLGHLVTREYRVTLTSTADGVRYSVRTREGAPLGTDLSPGELSARFPRAYRSIRSGVAQRPPAPGAIVWAGR
jgi:hypothetical protein